MLVHTFCRKNEKWVHGFLRYRVRYRPLSGYVQAHLWYYRLRRSDALGSSFTSSYSAVDAPSLTSSRANVPQHRMTAISFAGNKRICAFYHKYRKWIKKRPTYHEMWRPLFFMPKKNIILVLIKSLQPTVFRVAVPYTRFSTSPLYILSDFFNQIPGK